MGIEVERKVKIDDKESFLSKIKELGAEFVKEKHQVDKYFSHPTKDLLTVEPIQFIRVREQDGKAELGYHLVVSRDSAHEYETWCDKPEMLYKFLEHVGCKILGIIDKQRKYYKLTYKEREVEIVLDDVKELGVFAEAEVIIEDEKDIPESEKFIKDFLMSLGFSEKDFDVPRFSFIAIGRKPNL
jgi:adenylate cyclase class 2